MPASSHHPRHEFFSLEGETASYRIRDGWMFVIWNGAHSPPHEVKSTPPDVLAKIMLGQMPQWQKKYPEYGAPAVEVESKNAN